MCGIEKNTLQSNEREVLQNHINKVVNENIINCPGCNQLIQVPEDLKGQAFECPSCQLELLFNVCQDSKNVDISSHDQLTTLCPFCFEEIQAKAKKCKHCNEFVDISNSPSPHAQSRAIQSNRKKINRLNLWLKLWITCWLVGIPLLFVFGIGLIPLMIGVLFNLLILHSLWSLIPSDEAPATPLVTVFLLFIPLFNIYWFFVAYHTLAQKLNKELKKKNISDKNINEDISLICCISNCFSPLLILNVFGGIAHACCLFVMFKEFRNAAIAILEEV